MKRQLNRPKQAYLYKTCVKQNNPGDYERAGIVILESRRDLRRLYEMAPVRIVIYSHWEPSLPNAPGKDKIWEEASPTAATPES